MIFAFALPGAAIRSMGFPPARKRGIAFLPSGYVVALVYIGACTRAVRVMGLNHCSCQPISHQKCLPGANPKEPNRQQGP